MLVVKIKDLWEQSLMAAIMYWVLMIHQTLFNKYITYQINPYIHFYIFYAYSLLYILCYHEIHFTIKKDQRIQGKKKKIYALPQKPNP